MKEHSKKVLPLVPFALIFILSNLFLYENCVGSPVYKASAQDITCIERVAQFKTSDILQSLNNVSLRKSVKKPSSIFSKYLSDNKISPPPFNRCLVIRPAMKRCLDFPSKCIITIIQKMNRCHQSSDDEPSHFIFS
jgi:hypothetical protein